MTSFAARAVGVSGRLGRDCRGGAPSRGPTAVPTQTQSPGHRPRPAASDPSCRLRDKQGGRGQTLRTREREGHACPNPKNTTSHRNHLQVHRVQDSAAGLRRPFQKGPQARRPLPGSRLRAYQEGFPPSPEKRGSRCPNHLYKRWGLRPTPWSPGSWCVPGRGAW